MFRRVLANLGLMVVSLLVALTIAELTLRLAFPRYESAATPQYSPDNARIWSARPGRRFESAHPDTGVAHAVLYNSLALRQSREFEDLDSRTNIVFFGDSYTANIDLPSPYSFTEPLDFLLNLSQPRFNVLNAGVNGYGTDQSFLNYLDFPIKNQVHHIYYVLCANDLRNIYESNLFSLDENGTLTRNSVPQPKWWIGILARLHITYLLLDVRQRLLYARETDLTSYRELFEASGMREDHDTRKGTDRAQKIEQSFLRRDQNDDAKRALAIFNALLAAWQREANQQGSLFSVVLLPTGREDLFTPFIPDGIDVLSLAQAFSERMDGFSYDKVRFENDGHWNEWGNALAAQVLYDHLQKLLDLPALSPTEQLDALNRYYAAFGSWRPRTTTGDALREDEDVQWIRSRYVALEDNG